MAFLLVVGVGVGGRDERVVVRLVVVPVPLADVAAAQPELADFVYIDVFLGVIVCCESEVALVMKKENKRTSSVVAHDARLHARKEDAH